MAVLPRPLVKMTERNELTNLHLNVFSTTDINVTAVCGRFTFINIFVV